MSVVAPNETQSIGWTPNRLAAMNRVSAAGKHCADHDAQGRHCDGLTHDQAEQARSIRPQRGANADLPPCDAGPVRKHAVEPDHRENQGNDGERSREPAQKRAGASCVATSVSIVCTLKTAMPGSARCRAARAALTTGRWIAIRAQQRREEARAYVEREIEIRIGSGVARNAAKVGFFHHADDAQPRALAVGASPPRIRR